MIVSVVYFEPSSKYTYLCKRRDWYLGVLSLILTDDAQHKPFETSTVTSEVS